MSRFERRRTRAGAPVSTMNSHLTFVSAVLFVFVSGCGHSESEEATPARGGKHRGASGAPAPVNHPDAGVSAPLVPDASIGPVDHTSATGSGGAPSTERGTGGRMNTAGASPATATGGAAG